MRKDALVDVDQVGKVGKKNCFSLPRYFVPTGVLLFRLVRPPFMMAMSRSAGRKYWFNTVTRESLFECPPRAAPDFAASFASRLHWAWAPGVRVAPQQEVPPGAPPPDPKALQGDHFLRHVGKLMK